MQKKLTITVDEKIYDALHATIGRGNISRFLEDLVRPYLDHAELHNAYADMAASAVREAEADEWEGLTAPDAFDASR